MSTLDELMKVHARAAHRDFYRDGELYAPLWLIENKESKRLLIAAPIGKDDDRNAHGQMIRRTISEFGGVRYAYAAESWFLSLQPGAPMARPSTSADRREAIVINGEDINGEQR